MKRRARWWITLLVVGGIVAGVFAPALPRTSGPEAAGDGNLRRPSDRRPQPHAAAEA